MVWKDVHGRPELIMAEEISCGFARPRVTARPTVEGDLAAVDDDLAELTADDA